MTSASRSALGSTPPVFWDDACSHLGENDRIMKRLLAKGAAHWPDLQEDAFSTLARSIVAQRISATAAQKVWGGFMQCISGKLTPSSLLRLKIDDMRGAGIPAKKVEYLVSLALHFDNGSLKPKTWVDKDDACIVSEIMTVRGVARWAADMLLIFHLQRPNVLPLDDPSLVRGISYNYFSNEAVSRNEIKDLAKAWDPFCTVATWCLWQAQPPAAA